MWPPVLSQGVHSGWRFREDPELTLDPAWHTWLSVRSRGEGSRWGQESRHTHHCRSPCSRLGKLGSSRRARASHCSPFPGSAWPVLGAGTFQDPAGQA